MKKILKRSLSAIVDDIKVALRHVTKNAIYVGDLLREMKASPEVKHGDWLPLLKTHRRARRATTSRRASITKRNPQA
jgi:hypothetical protein